MTWILQHQVYLLAKCHIHVNDFISMSYPFFKKDIFGCTWDILDLKKAFGLYRLYLFMSYAIPILRIHVISLSGCLVQARK